MSQTYGCPIAGDLGPGAGQGGEDVRIGMGSQLGGDLGLQGLTWADKVASMATRAPVTAARAAPPAPVAPRGSGFQPCPQLPGPAGFPR